MAHQVQVTLDLNFHADKSSNQIQTFVCFIILLNDTYGFGGKYRVTWENSDLFSRWNICKHRENIQG